ncbi:MAG: hypothetical protein ACTSUF_03760, partial [Candidatus Heimdallarchaeaceae archaeon]
MIEELTRLEKNLTCWAIADAMNKVEARLDKLREKKAKGEKTFYVVGEGSEDINKVWERTMKELEALNNASKKITCST